MPDEIFSIGDSVVVYPSEDDIKNNVFLAEFEGIVVDVNPKNETYSVQDEYGQVFEVNADQLDYL